MSGMEARQRLGLGDADKVILFFGSIAPYKGLEYLIAAFHQILAWRDVEWNDLSRGMARNDDQLDTDEGHLRVFWRRWNELT